MILKHKKILKQKTKKQSEQKTKTCHIKKAENHIKT